MATLWLLPFVFACSLLTILLSPAQAEQQRATVPLSSQVLVVYNGNLAISQELANYYAKARGIPTGNMLALDCWDKAEISRTSFNKTMQQPIARALQAKMVPEAHRRIRFVVLLYGLPWRITETIKKPKKPFQRTVASVDSELSLALVKDYPLEGFVPNPLYGGKLSGATLDASQVLIVARLDGPTPARVRQMVDDALYGEANHLPPLALVDLLGIYDPKNLRFVGESSLMRARDFLQIQGLRVEQDKTHALAQTWPHPQGPSLYLGWYATQPGGLFAPQTSFTFSRGAVGFHMFSYSAADLRNATNQWAPTLLAKGAAAAIGSVAEPYQRMLPKPHLLVQSLLAGNTLGQAFYHSQGGLSWVNILLGDPLYRPFNNLTQW